MTPSERKPNRRFFGYLEAVFDLLYLLAAASVGMILLSRGAGGLDRLTSAMAFTLAAGDAFHLIPRICAVVTGDGRRFQSALGFGKLVTSITMTVFYVLLWQVGTRLFPPVPQGWTFLAYTLAGARILLCLHPRNRWLEDAAPLNWAVLRNLPFLLLGLQAALLFWLFRDTVPAFAWMWLAVVLSFAFYIPVVLWVKQSPKLGMLMLPKTGMYLWMLWMLVRLQA